MTGFKGLIDRLVRPGSGGLAAGAVLGGVALIAGLAYRASSDERSEARPAEAVTAPELNEDDAETVLKAMIAAAVSDGIIDSGERRRLDAAIAAANLGLDERRWLDAQLVDPPRIDAIAARVNTPELATQVFTAARLAITPDTLQERQFLKDLAEALDVPKGTVSRLEAELDA